MFDVPSFNTSFNPSLVWLSLGVVLVTLEIFTGTFYLLLIGICAFVTALVSYLLNLDLSLQIILCGALSATSIFTLRGRFKSKENKLLTPDEDSIVFLSEEIAPLGEGIVNYQGAPWSALNQSSEALKPNTYAVVIKTQGNKLLLKAIN